MNGMQMRVGRRVLQWMLQNGATITWQGEPLDLHGVEGVLQEWRSSDKAWEGWSK